MSFRSSKSLKVVLFLVIGTSVFAVHRWWTVKNYADTDLSSASPEHLLNEVEETLAQFALPQHLPNGDVTSEATDPTGELISKIDEAADKLFAQTSDSNSENVRTARTAQVKAYFFAAQRQPDAFAKRFDTLSTQLIEDYPGSTAAVEASILRFAIEHDLTKPLDGQTFQALKRQASGYANQRNGVALYSFVSHQLHSNGQIKSAKAVLDAGTDRYRGKPGWNHLFEQKFQQGHLTVPTATTAGGVFKSSSPGGSPSRGRS